jgi:hypothetical protein
MKALHFLTVEPLINVYVVHGQHDKRLISIEHGQHMYMHVHVTPPMHMHLPVASRIDSYIEIVLHACTGG